MPTYKLNPEALLNGTQTFEEAWNFILSHSEKYKAVLVYSSDTPERIKEFQKMDAKRAADLLEEVTAALVVRAVKEGFTRIISAGGETSGAVTKRLGFSSYLDRGKH